MNIEVLHKPVPLMDGSGMIKGEIVPLLFRTILEKLSTIVVCYPIHQYNNSF
jgi:hypothetical protein